MYDATRALLAATEIADLPLNALAPFALLLLHTEICPWCDPHGFCAIGRPLASDVETALSAGLVAA